MKMDFRAVIIVCGFLALTGCGKERTSSSTFEKASEECLGNAIPKRFVVKYFDGRTEVVSAESKEQFIDGFLKDNLNKIEFAEHSFKVQIDTSEIRTASADTMIADNWGAANVSAGSLWQQSVRGSGITVAIVDTGMDITHPQLRDQVAVNTGEMGLDAQGRDRSTNGIDDDGNGFIDDAYGYDFVRNQGLRGDYQGHGTHIGGVIAGKHSDTQAMSTDHVQGLAPQAKLLPLAFLDENGSGEMFNGVRAIQYAVSRGAKVINASWGGAGCSRSLKDTIAGLEAKGVIFVSAAGNESQNIDRNFTYPASLILPAQITVGAIGDHNAMATYSNYGRQTVHIFAPGTDIASSFPGGRLVYMTGTSMATPFVTGAVALLLGAEPTANVGQVRQALYTASSKNSLYINASQGRLNLAQALSELRRLMH